jgi:hypothetical protein
MQSNTYRQVEGVPEATTFVTNHIHQADSNLAKLSRHSGDEELRSLRDGARLDAAAERGACGSHPTPAASPSAESWRSCPTGTRGPAVPASVLCPAPSLLAGVCASRLARVSAARASRLPAVLGSPRFSAPRGSRQLLRVIPCEKDIPPVGIKISWKIVQ